MNPPSTAREALIVEAIGEVAQLLQRVEALRAALDETCQALLQASTTLENHVAGFERRMAAITENAKTQAVRYMAARTVEATRRSIDLQSRAMADAARVAFGAELGATMQRLQAMVRPLLEARERRWERWLTHAAAATASSAATWAIAIHLSPR